MVERLLGKTAIVTGAASGIGRAIALAFIGEGANVLATDIDAQAGEALRVQAGERLHFRRHDVTAESQWREAFEAASKLGSVTIVVNNAGTVLLKDLCETTLDEWRAQNAVNLDSVFLGTRQSIEVMRDGVAGRIINISSVNGLVGVHTAPAYCASKGGVTAFTKAAALYCASHGYDITVNSIHPGYVNTPLVGDLADRLGGDRRRTLGSFAKAHPLGRLGTPEDIAEGAVYLASEAGRWVTGSELVIDGGYLAQ